MGEKIIVSIDIRDLKVAKTGTKTYLNELSNVFAKLDHPRFKFHFIDSLFPVYTGNSVFLKLIEQFRFFCWKQISLPIIAFFYRSDIVFCSDYFVPYLNLGFKTIPVFHDAFFWEYPEHYNQYWLWLFNKIGVAAAKKSPYLVTTSAYAKKQIGFFSGIDTKKIIPVYEAGKVNERESKQNNPLPEIIRKKISQPYILHIGTWEKRKNLPRLIKAFHHLVENGFPDLQLILVGNTSPKKDIDDSYNIKKFIAEYHLEDKIFIPGYVDDEWLYHYYQNAAIYVFPSINEGFGLPVLEAFMHHIPVLVANNTCLPEIGGNAVISFDPFDPKDIADKIETVINNEELRKDLIEKGNIRLKDFSWEKTATHLLSIFERAVKE